MNKTKRRIFNTAVELFSAKGYDNTNIEEITAIAGVAKGTLYYHFTKKEDIFDMLLEEGLNLEKVKAITLVQIKVTVKYENFLNVIFSEFWGEENKNKKCRKAVYEYIKVLEDVIKEGIDNGEFYDGNVEALASGIFGVTVSSLVYRLKKNREVDVKQVYEGFIDTVVKGLKK